MNEPATDGGARQLKDILPSSTILAKRNDVSGPSVQRRAFRVRPVVPLDMPVMPPRAADTFKAEDVVSAVIETAILDYRALTIVDVRRAVDPPTGPK